MARGGTRPKPPHLHVVDGTHRTTRHGDAKEIRHRAAEDIASRLPSPPAYLGPLAKAEWRRLAPDLHRRGLLTHRHRAAFAGYCEAYADFQKACLILRKLDDDHAVGIGDGRYCRTRTGYLTPHPVLGDLNQASKRLRDYIQEFGLSPVAEARLVKPGKEAEDPLSDLADKARKAAHGPDPK